MQCQKVIGKAKTDDFLSDAATDSDADQAQHNRQSYAPLEHKRQKAIGRVMIVLLVAVKIQLLRHSAQKNLCTAALVRSLTAGRSFFFEPYLEAFRLADVVVFAPIFYKERLDDEERLDIEGLRQGLAAHGIESFAEASNDAVLARVLAEARPGDVIVTMSSGSFDGMPHRVLAALHERHGGV